MEQKFATIQSIDPNSNINYKSILHIGNIKINCTKEFTKFQRKMWLKCFGIKITPWYEVI